jgi:hypothetical protein
VNESGARQSPDVDGSMKAGAAPTPPAFVALRMLVILLIVVLAVLLLGGGLGYSRWR